MPHHQNGRSHQHLDTDRYKITPHLLALMSLFLRLILILMGMRQCSNFMRHVSVYCTPKTELLIHALCVLSMYILYTFNHIVTLLLLYPAFAGTDDLDDVLCQEDYDCFFLFPKCIHVCTCTIFLCKNSFEFVYIYTPVYIFNSNPGHKLIYYDIALSVKSVILIIPTPKRFLHTLCILYLVMVSVLFPKCIVMYMYILCV